jgi:UPF0716 family protein affecting phage T7 exclusion
MTIGGSIFLIALGAILKFAVTYTVAGIDINAVGVILMIAGLIGLIIGLYLLSAAKRRVVDPRVVQPGEPVYYDDTRPPAPPTY